MIKLRGPMVAIPVGRVVDSSRKFWFILVVGLLVAVWVLFWSIAVANQSRNPALSLQIDSSLPQAAARLTDRGILDIYRRRFGSTDAFKQQKSAQVPKVTAMLGGQNMRLTTDERSYIASAARKILKSTPYSSKALRQLATASASATERERLLRLANSVSKRDTLALLQLAELDLRNGKLGAGLASLDQALTVTTDLDTTVFPLLTSVSSDPKVAKSIGNMLARDPEWAERLMQWAMVNPQSMAPLSALLRYVPNDSVARAPGYGQQFVDQLAAQGRYAEAFTAYDVYSTHKQDVRNLTLDTFRPIDWRLIDSYDTGSRVVDKRQIEIFANPGRFGPIAEVITRLTFGDYQFSLKISEASGAEAQLRFVLQCVTSGPQRGESEQIVPLIKGRRDFAFSVPRNCPYQKLSIAVEASNDAASALVSDASLTLTEKADVATRSAART